VYSSPNSGKLLLRLPLTASSEAITDTAVSGLELPELTHDRKNRYSCVDNAKIIFNKI
jgi:hypothetical protein